MRGKAVVSLEVPLNVVEPLRKWIPLAEKWGVRDNQDRWQHEFATDQEVFEFAKFYWSHIETDNAIQLTVNHSTENDEYIALNYMWIYADVILARVQMRAIEDLFGFNTVTPDGRKVAYMQLLYESFNVDALNQRATFRMKIMLFDLSVKPFTLSLNSLRYLSVEMYERIGLTLKTGEWIVGQFDLRESREYVFPETKHFSLSTNRFKLKAEYGEVEVEKDW
jgi:hypothetical protein